MADASSLPWWATLVPVLATALGVFGTLAGTSLGEHRRDAAEKKRIRTEKFEQLVGAVYEYDQWLDDLRDVNAFGEKRPPTPASPFSKIEAIAAVYFPQFMNQIDVLSSGVDTFINWIFEAAGKRAGGLSGDKIKADFLQSYSPYREARDKLLKDLREFAQTEFQSHETPSLLARLTKLRRGILGC